MSPLHEFGPEGRITSEYQGPCVWCQQPSDSVLYAPALGRELPLHPTCGLTIIVKHKRWRAGLLRAGDRRDARAFELFGPQPAQLTSGTP